VSSTDDRNLSEQTDADTVGGTHYPPEQPLGVNDRGATDVEDSVEERRRREIPDWEGSGRPDDVAPLIDQAGEDGGDDEADSVAMEARRQRDPLGVDRTVQDLEEVEPAEEAAIHLTEDPPMGDGDGYVDEDR
jgi:hypothetical protein